jgi:hypothetical protein
LIKSGHPLFLILFIVSALNLGANETLDSYIQMLINKKTGRYSLSFLTDPEKMKYRKLIYRNRNTSFWDVKVNDIPYRLGSSRVFKTRIGSENEEPVVVYESSFLTVKMSFTPVKTISSPTANGIRITIQMINKDEAEASVGLRFLVDTYLGEGRKNIPFVTEKNNIVKEKIIESSSGVRYWISRGKDVSLMGSIADPLDKNAKRPDYLHFANWKKLSDVPWKASYHEGRSFNNLPYSIGDSAVSYYWEPRVLKTGGIFTYTVYLTTQDIAWYYPELYPELYVKTVSPVDPVFPEPVIEEITPEIPVEPAVIVSEPEEEQVEQSVYNVALIEAEARKLAFLTNENYNVIVLMMLKTVLQRFIDGEIPLNEIDILQIDLAIERYGKNQ